MSNPILRILDANFNRAREALRCMEEHARFVLEDVSLTTAIKGARHELKEIADCQFPIADCSPVGARDTQGDVGTGIEGKSEYERETPEEVVIAAAKRLSEAIRVLEEYGKLPKIDDADSESTVAFPKRLERLRYAAYEIERRLAMTFRAKQHFGRVRLYVLLTESLCRTGWFETAKAVIRGGAQCIQLREKSLPDVELLRRSRRLTALCREHGVIFIVNDRADIAIAAHAHGVHVGQDDISISDARRVLAANMIVGVSTHTIEQVQSAIATTPDYIAVGPMFSSETKPQSHIAGPELLSAAGRLTSLPIVAIGGIHAGNAGAIKLAASTCAICVCSAIISDPDPEAATRKIQTIAR